jgi:hypothetical protein
MLGSQAAVVVMLPLGQVSLTQQTFKGAGRSRQLGATGRRVSAREAIEEPARGIWPRSPPEIVTGEVKHLVGAALNDDRP